MTLLAAALAVLPVTAPVQAQPISVTPGRAVESLRAIAVAPAPTGSRIVAAMEDGSVRIIDGQTRATIRELPKHPQPAYAVAWSPNGQLIATGDESARVFIVNANTGAKVREYRVHTRGIQKLSFNSGNNLLISTGKDDEIKVYNLSQPAPKEVRSVLGQGANFYGAAFHPRQADTFATGILGPGGRLYSANSGRQIAALSVPDGQGVYDVAFNAAGTRIATANREGTAVVWDAANNQRLATLRGHEDWVIHVAFSPNGRLLATSSTDRTVRIWNTANFQRIATIESQSFVGSPVAFTACGRTLITVNDMGALQFNTVSPAQPAAAPAPAPAPRRRGG
jgi:WD40 repeat protein